MKSARYSVGAHETFVFRSGWLKKGLDAVREDPTVFSRDDAPVLLGVGKNMVRSIRFWCLATCVVAEEESRGKKYLRPTEIGERLLSDQGWDPYLEDPGSLWLLHWMLATNRQRASTWYHVFAGYPEPQFTKKQLVAYLQRVVEHYQQAVSVKSLERDVDCFVRTYSSSRDTHVLPEIALECPLAELNLLVASNEAGVYQFHIGEKETLPPEVFGFALIRFFVALGQTRRQLSMDECLYAPGSPGQVFRLDEPAVMELTEKVLPRTKNLIDIAESAGTTHLFFREERLQTLEELGIDLLSDYYAGEEGL